MCSTNSCLLPLYLFDDGPGKILLASTRSSFNDDKQRENTDSPINVTGIPRSSAEIAVHLPVPFCICSKEKIFVDKSKIHYPNLNISNCSNINSVNPKLT